MKVKTLTLLFLFNLLLLAQTGFTQHQDAFLEEIVLKLYQTFGNDRYDRPRVMVVGGDQMGAGYYSKEKTIKVEQKLLDVCRSQGKDSTAALYFILGHELTHFYQEVLSKGTGTTNFMAFTEHTNASYKSEREADLQGAFLSYLSGYKIDEVLPGLLEDLYTAYNLDKPLAGYPTKRQRLHAAGESLELCNRLKTIYDNSVALMVLGHYTFAREGFQTLLSNYQGYEIKYNIGLSALLEAIYLTERNVDPYFFPVEINVVSRLHKPPVLKGGKDLNIDEMWDRNRLFDMAKNYFTEVQRVNPTYIPAYIGYVIILTLETDFEGAKKVLEKTLSVPGNKRYRYELMLTEAIIEALKGHLDVAREVMLEILEDGPDELAELASLNLDRLDDMTSLEIRHRIEEVGINKESIHVPEGKPILLSNGTSMYEREGDSGKYYTYVGNSKSLALHRSQVDKNWIPLKGSFKIYHGNGFRFALFPEKKEYWKIKGDKVLEIGTIVKN